MSKVNRFLTLSVFAATAMGLSSFQSHGAIRHYAADASNSNWTLSSNTRLNCGLSHSVPRYGEATFTSVANKNLNMLFEMDMMRLPRNYALAQVTSVPPAWRSGVAAKSISNMELKKQYNPEMPEKAAWTMLNELEKGFIPTVYYADWYSPYDKVAVGLSAINFIDVYDQFLRCVDSLLPYSFEDVSYTVLKFKKNSDELSKESISRLAQISEYLRHNQMVQTITIDAYSDSHGGWATNLKVSKKRAKKIADHIVSLGVDEGRVKVTGHGEKRHAASNKTELGRMTNRRVVVQMNMP